MSSHLSRPPGRAFSGSLPGGGRLVLHQQKSGGDLILGAAAANRYVLRTEQGAELGRVAEITGGWLATLLRWVFASGRPFRFVLEAGGVVALEVRRPWFWFLSTVLVSDGDGRALGRIEQRFTVANRRFEVIGADDRRLAEIRGPWSRPWTFEVLVEGRRVAVIEKRWPGIEELFTGATSSP